MSLRGNRKLLPKMVAWVGFFPWRRPHKAPSPGQYVLYIQKEKCSGTKLWYNIGDL